MTDPQRDRPTAGILSRNRTRQADRWAIERLGLPGVVLMENAGGGVARRLGELGCSGPVVILCGPGNNGGDGFVLARHLANRGVPVSCRLPFAPDRYAGDAAIHLRVAERLGLPIERPASPDEAVTWNGPHAPEWIVDALLGTGAVGDLREPIRSWVDAANRSPARRLAVDLPTGLDADTDQRCEPTFRAEETVTFVALKPGLVLPDNGSVVGRITVVDIGVDPRRMPDESESF